MQIDQQSITFILGIISIVTIIFNVYEKFRNPQIKTDQTTADLNHDIATLKSEVKEIKETHLRTLESEIKNLNSNLIELGKTVVKLATIIDERIPKGPGTLTPPGR